MTGVHFIVIFDTLQMLH